MLGSAKVWIQLSNEGVDVLLDLTILVLICPCRLAQMGHLKPKFAEVRAPKLNGGYWRGQQVWRVGDVTDIYIPKGQ